jgi:hypothetical protein
MTTPDSKVTTEAVRSSEIYLLRRSPDSDWSVVTKQEWVQAECQAGFVNTMGQPNEPATGGFHGDVTRGSIVDPAYFDASYYTHEPDLLAAIREAIADC